MPPRFGKILPAVALCAAAAFSAKAQEQLSPEATAAGVAWVDCVVTAGKRFATGPDSAEFIVKTALLACPRERARALTLFGDGGHRRVELVNYVMDLLERAATQKVALAVAEARANRHPTK